MISIDLSYSFPQTAQRPIPGPFKNELEIQAVMKNVQTNFDTANVEPVERLLVTENSARLVGNETCMSESNDVYAVAYGRYPQPTQSQRYHQFDTRFQFGPRSLHNVSDLKCWE